MEEILDDYTLEESEVIDSNLFAKIWLKPTATLTYILKNCPEKYMMILFIIGGTINAIEQAIERSYITEMPLLALLLIAAFAGAVLGWMGYFFYAWVLSWAGNWIGGKAEPSKFRTIIAWSLVPIISSSLLTLPGTIYVQYNMVFSDNYDIILSVVAIINGLLQIVFGIWSLIITVQGIRIVQNFSQGKAIVNLFLPGLVIGIPIIILVLILT
jgi:hypothetical protein